MAAQEEPRIVEQDGHVVRIVCGEVEVMAEMVRVGDELIFDRLSIDGAGPGSVGLVRLRRMARAFGATQGVARIRIRGTTRTTGASPGKLPREIIIEV